MEKPENFADPRSYNPFAPKAVEESTVGFARKTIEPEMAEMEVPVDRPVFIEQEGDAEKVEELRPLVENMMDEISDPLDRYQKKTTAIRSLRDYLLVKGISEEQLQGCRLWHLLLGSTPRPGKNTLSTDVFDGSIEQFIRSNGEVPKE